ncbi:hypothetical protein QTO34_016837 [Cnephaeus nilssonii]|uniref:Jun dimerization protein 2 n=1 Tax=Cnephaeus nilssonii TaxID=3371016 RepID=A0AA40I331_CNENI|nr:hypothetical protein QTO34_016837 [Eptesicus nilssonii]
MMPGQIPDPSMTAGSLPGLGPLTGLPSSALSAEELKYADIHNIGAMISPLHFLKVKLGKRPQPVKSELDKEESEGKALGKEQSGGSPMPEQEEGMEELKQEQQQLILILNRHRPTCIVRTDSFKTPTQKATHCWSRWRRSDHGLEEEEEEEKMRRGRRRRGPGLQEAGQRLWAGETPNWAAVGTSLASPPGLPPNGPPSSQENP